MNDQEIWTLFERLADEGLSAEDRTRLEAQVAGDPELSARFEAFRTLSDWPQLERLPNEVAARNRVYQSFVQDRDEGLVSLDLSKLFPIFFGGAVAAALVLGVLNFWQFCELAGGTFEAAFGMPAESIETVIVSQL